jgi:hypothetical protein
MASKTRSTVLLNLSQLTVAAQANFDDARENFPEGSVERSQAIAALASAHQAAQARIANVRLEGH